MLGRDTSVGDDTVITNSIIGRRCQIGRNVTIDNAYIWDDVVVGENSTVTQSIVAAEAVVGSGCTISPGALLSFGVRISDKTTIRHNARITRAKRARLDIDGAPMARVPPDTNLVGSNGDGYAFEDPDSDVDEETTLQSGLIYSTQHLNISQESISTISSDITADTETNTSRSRLQSFTGSISDAEEDGGGGSGEAFHRDAVADILRTPNRWRRFPQHTP